MRIEWLQCAMHAQVFPRGTRLGFALDWSALRPLNVKEVTHRDNVVRTLTRTIRRDPEVRRCFALYMCRMGFLKCLLSVGTASTRACKGRAMEAKSLSCAPVRVLFLPCSSRERALGRMHMVM